MENTEKSKLLQEENNYANNNLGITQSSGLDRHAVYSRKNEEGKRVARTVYGKTKEECEAKLMVLVESMKAEKLAESNPDRLQDMDMPLLTM